MCAHKQLAPAPRVPPEGDKPPRSQPASPGRRSPARSQAAPAFPHAQLDVFKSIRGAPGTSLSGGRWQHFVLQSQAHLPAPPFWGWCCWGDAAVFHRDAHRSPGEPRTALYLPHNPPPVSSRAPRTRETRRTFPRFMGAQGHRARARGGRDEEVS